MYRCVIKTKKVKEKFAAFLEIALDILRLLIFDVFILICMCIIVCLIGHTDAFDELNAEPISVVKLANNICVEEYTETYLLNIGDSHKYCLSKNIILQYGSKKYLLIIVILLSNVIIIYWDGYTSGLWGENIVFAVLMGIPIMVVSLFVEVICNHIPNALKSVREFFHNNSSISKENCDNPDDIKK